MMVDATYTTVGEALLGRKLEKEKRFGVDHFKPGQHEAVIYRGLDYGTDRPAQIGRITYVDAMGHACVVLAYRFTDDGSDWFPTWVGRAGQTWKEEARRAPATFVLSQKMLAALALAKFREDDTPPTGAGSVRAGRGADD